MSEKNMDLKTELLHGLASQICKESVEPTQVTNHANLIMKSNISFAAKIWWSIIRSRISATFTNKVITREKDVLLASILAGYDIVWAHIMAEQIHESTIWTYTLLPFPIFIYRLCNEARVRVSLHVDLHIEALNTMDPNLIKADDNLVTLQ